jgi:nucleotide-binding universal stress UspA family protein
MNAYPFLSLHHVTIDPAVARRLPRRLAYYYLALPLAYDGDQCTVVMAHPENQAAAAVMQTLLGGQVVFVQGTAAEIKAALDRVWPDEVDSAAPRILSWGATPEAAALAKAAAGQVAAALSTPTPCLDTGEGDLETVLTVAREGQYSLTVVGAPPGETWPAPLRESATPLLLARRERISERRILVGLRGHSSDDTALDWVGPLAHAAQVQVTLLATTPSSKGARRGVPPSSGLSSMLQPDDKLGEHVAACARRLAEAGVQGTLKLCQGAPEQCIAGEIATGAYDLFVIAAEAYGDFVQRILREIDKQAPGGDGSVLVIKTRTK